MSTMGQGTAPPLDFDDHTFQTRPWPVYDWYRTHSPVHWSPQLRVYFVFGYTNVRAVLGSPKFGTYHPFRRSRPTFGGSLLDTDGTEHDRLRSALAGAFRPPAVRAHAERAVTPIVEQLLDEVLAGDPDLIPATLAHELPMRVICAVLGLPAADTGLLHRLMAPLIDYVDHAPVPLAEVLASRDELRAYLERHLAGDGGGGSGGGLLALLRDADAPLETGEIVSNSMLLMAAATKTTGASVVNLLARVGTTPGTLPGPGHQPRQVTATVVETLRHEPPLHVTLRYAAEDVTIAGTTIPRGAPVQACLASANRDPAVYSDPDEWRPGRAGPLPLTFGYGRHHCLGSGLAQAELETLLTSLGRRLSDLTVTAPEHPVPHGRTFRVVPGLRIACTPRRA
ncbi:cytochrome P450 [Dactylosporangium aurantiacum]|uniref:Cytochrome P450 n=1 Tax=Dactylosporangium aurantiacum TaxID=35754 RepID=A0A9Q9MH11_9ACTN|nr:cytochrome P450 [Dactylosporangium aurantiacum]MDG6103897.1 cytochrome P450 [Dactylosporangium aurantiacum]UWZ58913.1 cytochrome P450 [Dactylosporangium aurantiacum]